MASADRPTPGRWAKARTWRRRPAKERGVTRQLPSAPTGTVRWRAPSRWTQTRSSGVALPTSPAKPSGSPGSPPQSSIDGAATSVETGVCGVGPGSVLVPERRGEGARPGIGDRFVHAALPVLDRWWEVTVAVVGGDEVHRARGADPTLQRQPHVLAERLELMDAMVLVTGVLDPDDLLVGVGRDGVGQADASAQPLVQRFVAGVPGKHRVEQRHGVPVRRVAERAPRGEGQGDGFGEQAADPGSGEPPSGVPDENHARGPDRGSGPTYDPRQSRGQVLLVVTEVEPVGQGRGQLQRRVGDVELGLRPLVHAAQPLEPRQPPDGKGGMQADDQYVGLLGQHEQRYGELLANPARGRDPQAHGRRAGMQAGRRDPADHSNWQILLAHLPSLTAGRPAAPQRAITKNAVRLPREAADTGQAGASASASQLSIDDMSPYLAPATASRGTACFEASTGPRR